MNEDEVAIDSDYCVLRVWRMRKKVQDDHGLCIDLKEFDGNFNPDEFIDWLNAIIRAFECKKYYDERKCKVVVLKFKDYPSIWWENINKIIGIKQGN